MILSGAMTHILPDEFVKAANFILHLKKGARVINRGFDFKAITHDAGVV